MKPALLSTIQNLGDRVIRLREAIHAAPQRAARVREAVVVTADQLRQVRSEVQAGISELRADGEGRVVGAMREIGDNEGVLLEAGFALTGMDMELGSGSRLIVHMEKIADIGIERLRKLAEAHPDRAILRGLLNALLQAEQLAARVQVPNLEYRTLSVFMGPAPSMRVGWRLVDSPEPEAPRGDLPPRLGTQAAASETGSAAGEASTAKLGPIGTLFERPFVIGSAGTATPAATPPATHAHAASPRPEPESALNPGKTGSTGDWRKDALDRFKRMPDLGRGGSAPG